MKLILLLTLLTGCAREGLNSDSGSEGGGAVVDESWSYNLITQSLDFGDHDVGTSTSQVIVLQNNGEAALLLLDLDAPQAKGLSVTMPAVPVLQRGDVANIVVTWNPAEAGDMSGLITMKLGASATTFEEVEVPVTGKASGATLVISSSEYDFGDINVGCEDELTVTITNTGNSTVTVDEVSIDGDSAFTVDLGEHSIPMDLEPFQSLGVDVSYNPVDDDQDQAYLQVKTAAGTVASAIEGKGAVDGEDEVTYEVGVQQKATIIWHVNEVAMPGAAGYYQEVFYAALPHYFEQMKATRANYRMAFIWNTDGSVDSTEPYIDQDMSADEAWEVAQEMMENGASIGDNDRNFTTILASLTAQGDWLFEDGYWDDSKLTIITVQRDVEQSGGSWANYVTQAQAFKDDPANLTFNAIAGPPPQGCGGYAEYFSGYYEAVIATDGLFLSVCDEDWDEHMDKLVAASLGGGGEYFPLTGNPLPSTITVFLDDVRSSQGWTYDSSVNSVVFDEDSYPSEGTEVRIKYLKAIGCG